MRNLILIIVTLALSAFSTVRAQQPVVVEAVMDSSVLWMGEQTLIHLSLTQDKDMQILPPQIDVPGELVKGVEVVDLTQPDTLSLNNNRLQIKQEVLVTSFDSGLYYIPPFKYVFDEDTFATESLSLKIVPVDVPEGATATDVKDIKDVVAPPFVLWDFIPAWMVILLAVVAILAIVAFWAIKHYKNRKVEVTLPLEKQIPPYDLAMQALQQLRESKLWQQGQEKQYYTRLVDILREYIDSRFGINAMEMTSSQILAALHRNKDTKEVNKYLNEILSMADFVKFAKMRPLPDDNERVMRQALDFVELTRPQPEPLHDGESKAESDENNIAPKG
ncbi:MAG: DUF4381 family protein [Bacteroidaceae bacterium]|nr:DUF4381 family protein [Bacteroidaceae bacterium]